ncbi:MAG: fumarylacetoacetate hydrolase family protein, partial [Bacteroidota bacterium]
DMLCSGDGARSQTVKSAMYYTTVHYSALKIEHVSKFFTLNPGDLLFTGTPSGVGAARKPPVFLQVGDALEVTIQSVGTLKNRVADCR